MNPLLQDLQALAAPVAVLKDVVAVVVALPPLPPPLRLRPRAVPAAPLPKAPAAPKQTSSDESA